MSKWTLYHNPRCSKSRQALALLQEAGIEPEIIEYLKNPLSSEEILALFKSVDAELKEFLRTNEAEYKEQKPSLNSENEVAEFLVKYPKVLQRPIIVKGSKGVIGRPPENWEKLK